MRIWDISVDKLCRKHLLGEHLELHSIWSVLLFNKKGYGQHPETLRWKGKLNALWLRHEEQVNEMISRGYNHKSDLDLSLVTDNCSRQEEFVNTIPEQINILRNKKCECKI